MTALEALLSRLDASVVMGEAQLLVLLARVYGQTGRYEESLTTARAARLLAEHERDWGSLRGAVTQILSALQSLERPVEANALAEGIANANAEYVDSLLLAEALACMGKCHSTLGDLARAEVSFHAVLEVCGEGLRGSVPAHYARAGLALLPSVVLGDWNTSRAELAAIVDECTQLPSSRAVLRGNLAACLMECGRFERAETLARSVVSEAERYGLGRYVGSFSHQLAHARLIRGDNAGAVAQMRRGIARSMEANDTAGSAVDRIWLSQALRAMGEAEESLSEAEMALEYLSKRDDLGFKRLAAYEVGASYLACGDLRAARRCITSLGDLDRCENLFHRTAAALTLAECDRREGNANAALSRLAPLAAYLYSESPNRLVAFYSRAFPNLLGLVALTVGVENLPVHMLRLIPPESAEIILGETRSWLDDSVWRALGLRLLGEEELGRFLSRDGLPVCHVRFFGALEVTIGGRSIREKDWRKRKARLLFAMLVSRRGYDVPREQIFEHLFAEMSPERAKNNLYVSWSTMKSVLLGEGAKGADLPYLETIGGVCRAVSANIRSDIDDFDKLLVSASQHAAAGEYPDALLDYEALSSLYRGELLPGDVYDDWFAELREHYRITFVDAMLAASSLLMDADDPGNALVFVRRAIQTDPLREDLYQAALRCQIAAGQRSGAIDTYVQCRSKLADDLGLDPSVETKALYDQILAMEDRPRVVPLDPFVD
jgi:DNA-binding SARP family transcriptional activator